MFSYFVSLKFVNLNAMYAFSVLKTESPSVKPLFNNSIPDVSGNIFRNGCKLTHVDCLYMQKVITPYE